MIDKLEIEGWFKDLQKKICNEFENLERVYDKDSKHNFNIKPWRREQGGGGIMTLMRGEVFEKVGVNFSAVSGEFNEKMRTQIPGAKDNPQFYATGISLVAHMRSPLVPAIHMNTRFIQTQDYWFGGGIDLNPAVENPEETEFFHKSLENRCNEHDADYYPRFKKWCDEYFFIKHRNIARGVGGIFYDYLKTDFNKDFAFTKDIGSCFLQVFLPLVKANMFKQYDIEQKKLQLTKRGYYTEFNLLYDRGTKFGFETNGNIEAILMSLPPEASW